MQLPVGTSTPTCKKASTGSHLGLPSNTSYATENSMRPEAVSCFWLGFLLFVGTETGWYLFRSPIYARSPWVMEPNPGILIALFSHFVGALLFSFALRPGVRGYVAFASGAAIAVVVMLFLVGPGNLWPIVLVINWVFLAPALAAGFAAGYFFQR